MTPGAFRALALSLPEAVEGAHMGTADFRVRGRIFATLREAEVRAVVKLTPEQQEAMTGAEPAMLSPVRGGWGGRGWTQLHLGAADEVTVRDALRTAWRNVAPKRLAATLD